MNEEENYDKLMDTMKIEPIITKTKIKEEEEVIKKKKMVKVIDYLLIILIIVLLALFIVALVRWL